MGRWYTDNNTLTSNILSCTAQQPNKSNATTCQTLSRVQTTAHVRWHVSKHKARAMPPNSSSTFCCDTTRTLLFQHLAGSLTHSLDHSRELPRHNTGLWLVGCYPAKLWMVGCYPAVFWMDCCYSYGNWLFYLSPNFDWHDFSLSYFDWHVFILLYFDWLPVFILQYTDK